jgi:hypothetical protein
MKIGAFNKQPAERLSHTIVYSSALDTADSISLIASCVAEPAGLTVTAGLAASDRVRVWTEGGTDGVTYKITVTIETAGGEVLQDELTCKVREL